MKSPATVDTSSSRDRQLQQLKTGPAAPGGDGPEMTAGRRTDVEHTDGARSPHQLYYGRAKHGRLAEPTLQREVTGIHLGLGSTRPRPPGDSALDTRLQPPASVNHVNTYSGPARLILVDGTRVLGTASLKMNPHGRTPGWGGTFRPDQTTAATQDATNDLQIELPYEQVGEVTVTGTRRLLATQILMSLAGRGPAPF